MNNTPEIDIMQEFQKGKTLTLGIIFADDTSTDVQMIDTQRMGATEPASPVYPGPV